MWKNLTLLISGCCLVLLGSCGSGSEPDQAVEEAQPDEARLNVEAPVEEEASVATDTLPFENPVVAPQAQALGLIPYTDPATRLREAEARSGRSNPFDTLPDLRNRIEVTRRALPEPPAAPTVNEVAGAGGAGAGTGGTNGGTGLPEPPAGSGLPEPQPLPRTALANAVSVTGVVQIGSTLRAIVKAPEEATARYVTAGQSLSNGKVRVKRIELLGSQPVVVLEENGIEVFRSVGDTPEEAEPTETASAELAQVTSLR